MLRILQILLHKLYKLICHQLYKNSSIYLSLSWSLPITFIAASIYMLYGVKFVIPLAFFNVW